MSAPSRFGIALRGYARDEVDALVDRAEAASATGGLALRAAVRDELRTAKFTVTWRGYQRQQVALFFTAFAAELAAEDGGTDKSFGGRTGSAGGSLRGADPTVGEG